MLGAVTVTRPLDCSVTNTYGCSYLIIKRLPWPFELCGSAATSPESTTTCRGRISLITCWLRYLQQELDQVFTCTYA